jgi:RNA methyltransferase, TrmH family
LRQAHLPPTRCLKPDLLVRAVAEWLQTRTATAAERDRVSVSLDVVAVLIAQIERPTHEQGAVLVRGDRAVGHTVELPLYASDKPARLQRRPDTMENHRVDASDATVIISPANPMLKRIRRLRSRKHREREGVFFVEGIQSVFQAARNEAEIEAIVFAPDLLRSDRATRMVWELRQHGTRVVTVSPEAFESVAERENPSGLGAIVKAHAATLERLQVTSDSIFVALDQVEKPGNVGSIIRSVDGAGADGVIVIGDSTDPYHPTAVKASMGTLFSVPVTTAPTVDDVLVWAEQQGLHTVGTSAHADTTCWSTRFELPTLLLFGNEGSGLGQAVLRRTAKSVSIPMSGTATSLNLAVAVGIVLYEVRRQQTLS